MIVDFHVHCFPDELAVRAVPQLAKTAGIPAYADGTVADIKASMEKAGVDGSVVLSIATKPSQTQNINNWSARINTGNMIAFGSIHPQYAEWKQELKRIKDLGLKGIKFHPEYQCFFVDEPSMYAVYEEAFAIGLIIIFHAGVDLGFDPPYHCTPDRLLKLVKAFPEGRMVAAHMGGFSYWEDVERLLVGQNLYFDTSFSIGKMSDVQAKRIILEHGYEKILFASDSPWGDQAEELQRVKKLGLGSTVEKAILGENARKLLGIAKHE